MDPITLIITALAAGASAGALDAVKDDVKEAVKKAYAKLRGLARGRVAVRPDGALALDRYETAPETWKPVLTSELTEAGAAGDNDLVAAAKALMELVDQAGAKAGKYNVTITGGQGVQVGDGNTQSNVFYNRLAGPRPASESAGRVVRRTRSPSSFGTCSRTPVGTPGSGRPRLRRPGSRAARRPISLGAWDRCGFSSSAVPGSSRRRACGRRPAIRPSSCSC
jgi:hypothetical protein